ncbi:hypothetical protein Prudu_012357 [Prunus dulcis]|uniref:Uncharacterized protein n=1 Tax=Prunus dulcis TaxID=3755 RepID=A0A4Y1RD22_PRUDU|nr:hypothetical protein Prudu_012357 [Prunus dulcis]
MAATTNPKHDFSCPLWKMCRALPRVLATTSFHSWVVTPPSLLRMLVFFGFGKCFPNSFTHH